MRGKRGESTQRDSKRNRRHWPQWLSFTKRGKGWKIGKAVPDKDENKAARGKRAQEGLRV
jgi:hypothetical protein